MTAERREHDLKTWPGPFDAVRDDLKPWELRKNDRDYRVGDRLNLRKWDPEVQAYTGEAIKRDVTWMLEGPAFGLPEGYVIMSLAKADQIMGVEGEAKAGTDWLIPLAVWLAAERVRVDAANTMRHDTTSDLTPRLMCRVGVSDIGLVLAWLDQHRTTENPHG